MNRRDREEGTSRNFGSAPASDERRGYWPARFERAVDPLEQRATQLRTYNRRRDAAELPRLGWLAYRWRNPGLRALHLAGAAGYRWHTAAAPAHAGAQRWRMCRSE